MGVAQAMEADILGPRRRVRDWSALEVPSPSRGDPELTYSTTPAAAQTIPAWAGQPV